jgi:hypothetical protein
MASALQLQTGREVLVDGGASGGRHEQGDGALTLGGGGAPLTFSTARGPRESKACRLSDPSSRRCPTARRYVWNASRGGPAFAPRKSSTSLMGLERACVRATAGSARRPALCSASARKPPDTERRHRLKQSRPYDQGLTIRELLSGIPSCHGADKLAGSGSTEAGRWPSAA